MNKINTTLRFGDGIDRHFRLPYETSVTNKVLYQHSKFLMHKQRYSQEINILNFILFFITVYWVDVHIL